MNTFGRKFRVSIFGESHGELIGVVMDGVPAGLELSAEDFSADILRRKSGSKGTTPRIEADVPYIVSGVYEGHTTNYIKVKGTSDRDLTNVICKTKITKAENEELFGEAEA